MSDEFITPDPNAKFNAGVSIALGLNWLVHKGQGYFFRGQYKEWCDCLEAIERQMYPKFRKRKEAREELANLHSKHRQDYELYTRKTNLKLQIGPVLKNQVKHYLAEYEKALLYWRDEFGYGMPEEDDLTKAAFR